MNISALQFANYGPGAGYLNVYQTVSNLMASRNSATSLLPAQTSYQVSISGLGQLRSALSSFQAVAQSMTGSAFKVYSATPSVAGVATATTSTSSVPGSYTVQVTQLAQSQTLTSAPQASQTAAIGSGTSTTLTFQLGTTNGAVFTPNPGQATKTVTIDMTNNSLQGIASAINSANIGVNAKTTFDGTNYRLALSSINTGASNSMSVGVTGDVTLQGLLAYNPAGVKNLTQTSVAQDALAAANGIATSSATNTLTNALAGTSINLTGIGTTSIVIAPDVQKITNNVSTFISAYNSLRSTISALGKGDLSKDGDLKVLQRQLTKTVTSVTGPASSGYAALSQVGVSFQKDGTLALNTTTLQNAINVNASGVANLFTNNGQGVADKLVVQIQNWVGAGGTIASEVNGLKSVLRALTSNIGSISHNQSIQTQTLTNQFSNLNVTLGRGQAMTQLLSSMFSNGSSIVTFSSRS